MNRFGVMFLAFVTLAGCSTGVVTARSAVDSAGDTHAVEAALQSWYDASARHDSAAYDALMLPEFFIFEDTTRYDRATLLALVASGFAAGTDHATMSDFNTQVSGDVAWSSFRNTEYFTPNGAAALPVRRYLETAVLRRVGGQWRLERYHATRINRPLATR